MTKLEPRYEPAECSSNCEDTQCPYIHFEAWEVNGIYFRTFAEAEAAARTPQGSEEANG